jgi:hypothetical protein
VHFTVILTLLVALDLFEPWELLNRVRDVDACINTSLHDSEYFVAGGDACDTDVQECSEWFSDFFLAFAFECILVIHYVIWFTIDGFGSFVILVKGIFLICVSLFG